MFISSSITFVTQRILIFDSDLTNFSYILFFFAFDMFIKATNDDDIIRAIQLFVKFIKHSFHIQKTFDEFVINNDFEYAIESN